MKLIEFILISIPIIGFGVFFFLGTLEYYIDYEYTKQFKIELNVATNKYYVTRKVIKITFYFFKSETYEFDRNFENYESAYEYVLKNEESKANKVVVYETNN